MTRDIIALLVIILGTAGVLAGIAWVGPAGAAGTAGPHVEVFNLTGIASQGVWTLEEVRGINYWWETFQPAVIHVTLGSDVVLNLRSADVFHRFYVPGLGIDPVDVEPGHMATVRFHASKPGVYQYYCSTMCGSCHFYMRGWIVVTPPGERPIEPPPLVCGLCIPPRAPEQVYHSRLEMGADLYERKGCITCHGPEGRGGIPNDNSTAGTVPDHETTAEKLFLQSEDDAMVLISLIESELDWENETDAGITAFPVVRARWQNFREIIRTGRYTSKRDPDGAEPPLQMPAWQFLLEEEEIDALLTWFVSLYPWEDG